MEDVISVDAAGERGRTDSGFGGNRCVRGRRGDWGPRPQMRPRDGCGVRRICGYGCVEEGGGAEGHRCGRGHRTTAVVPAWTWRHWTAAWGVVVDVDVVARTTAGNVAVAPRPWHVEGEEERTPAASYEAT